ncbi:MAG: LysR family transcriptional regulator [Pseudomonadota bacterium]
MARNLDLAALRSLIAVAETGGVTRAAERLHLTQSAVSMQIKRLEETLGVALLHREGRGVVVTKAGEELLAQARRLLALNDEIWARTAAPRFVGELTLGMPHDVAHLVAPAVLKRFHIDHPQVRVSLVTPPTVELLRDWADRKVDVILTTEFDCGPGGETLTRRPLVWVGAPEGRAWRRRPVPLAFPQRCAFRTATFTALDQAGLEWDWTIDTANTLAETASIAADLAICTLMRRTIPPQLQEIDHGGALPDVADVLLNIYGPAEPGEPLAMELDAYVRRAVRETMGD